MGKQARIAALRYGALAASLLFLFFVPPARAEDCSESRGGAIAASSRSAWADWCRNCGGTVNITSGSPTCTPGPDWGKSSSSGTASPTFVPTGDMRYDLPLMGLDLGLNMLSEGFRDAEEKGKRRKAMLEYEEYRKRMEAERQAAEEAARREASYSRIAGSMKGVEGGGRLRLKGSGSERLRIKKDAAEGRSAFNEYVVREEERREGFAKTADQWCGLNAPLYPEPPLMPFPIGQYEKMKEYYQASKAAWDKRCKANQAATPALPPATKSPAMQDAAPQKPKKSVPLPIACEDCWGNFDRESRACADHETNIERLVCLNDVRDKWVVCMGGCRAEPKLPMPRP